MNCFIDKCRRRKIFFPDRRMSPKEVLNKLIPFMVRQTHHERNQQLTVRPEPAEGFNQRFPKRYRSNVRRALLLSLLLIGAGCSLRTKPVLITLHDLGPARHPEKAVSASSLDAPVWLWDDRIRYRLLYADATAIRFYAQDRWEAPPPTLLEPYLSFIEKRQDIMLQIRLTEFEQQFDTLEQSRVILSFQVEARSLNNNRSIGKRDFRLEQATATANAAGAISSFATLTHQAVAEIQDWLLEVSSDGAASPDISSKKVRHSL